MYIAPTLPFSVSLVLATVASTASAAPSILAGRDAIPTAVVWMCQDTQSHGACQSQSIPFNNCTQFANGYAGKLKTIENLSYASNSKVTCSWYLTQDCSGDAYTAQVDDNLTDGGGKYQQIESAKCAPA